MNVAISQDGWLWSDGETLRWLARDPPPPGLEACEPYLATDYLPELRRVLGTLKQVAQEAGSHGLALTRE